MSNKQYRRTLYLPCLQGQYKVWQSSILPQCNEADAVVSFGDLIGCYDEAADNESRGRNEATLTFTRMYSTYHSDWTQLIGPNEIAALNSPQTWTNQNSTEYLRTKWLEEGFFQVASVDNGRLQTHGGLTYGEWIALDKPSTAETAAERLNEKYSGTLFQGLSYRLTGQPNYSANPIWADPVLETYPSWLTAPEDCPFDQMHAEASVNTDLGRRLMQDPLSPLAHFKKTLFKPYGAVVYIGEAEFTALTLNLIGDRLSRLPNMERVLIAQTK